MMITGHSVFSQRENKGPRLIKATPGLLNEKFVISTEALDEKVEAISVGPHSEWVDAYLKLKARRGPVGLLEGVA